MIRSISDILHGTEAELLAAMEDAERRAVQAQAAYREAQADRRAAHEALFDVRSALHKLPLRGEIVEILPTLPAEAAPLEALPAPETSDPAAIGKPSDEMRFCPDCNEDRPIAEFGLSGRSRIYQKYCKKHMGIRSHPPNRRSTRGIKASAMLEENVAAANAWRPEKESAPLKRCTACGEEKPVTAFYKSQGRCKPCHNRINQANAEARFHRHHAAIEAAAATAPAVKSPIPVAALPKPERKSVLRAAVRKHLETHPHVTQQNLAEWIGDYDLCMADVRQIIEECQHSAAKAHARNGGGNDYYNRTDESDESEED